MSRVVASGPRLSGADARRYEGRWVVLRDGTVVASSRWFRRRLQRRHPGVLYRVPPRDLIVHGIPTSRGR